MQPCKARARLGELEMFDNMKKLWEMKKQLEEVKKALDAVSLTEEDKNVKVTVSGSQEIKDIEIKCDLKTVEPYQLQVSVKDMLNKAMKKAQKEAAGKMSSMGGFPGL